MGAADVEANYTVVKAYQFTSLTSIQVLLVLMGAAGPEDQALITV